MACLIRDVTSADAAQEPPRALVSTRRWQHGFAALQAYRPRWHIEDETYRELEEGWAWKNSIGDAIWLQWPFGGCVAAESGRWATLLL